ncbi:MAG: HesB/IscA family protein [Planctomycetota bacterium]|jgi:iron-sulfur cluster assembly protein
MSLNLTERAAMEIKTILAQQNLTAETAYLRLGVKGGGCSGFTYSLDLSQSKGENDEEYEDQGIRMICDPKSYLYLNGTTVDFKDELMGRGFVFDNPNANGTCGCGSSFSA